MVNENMKYLRSLKRISLGSKTDNKIGNKIGNKGCGAIFNNLRNIEELGLSSN